MLSEAKTMPIYYYKAKEKGCPYCESGFEQLQSMSETPLKKCPRCGGPVRKIPAKFSGGTPTLSNGNLRDKGFTKLVNKGDGSYEKVT